MSSSAICNQLETRNKKQETRNCAKRIAATERSRSESEIRNRKLESRK